MSPITTTMLAGLLALSTAACSIDVARNPDGSLQVESSISEEALTSEIARALSDSDVTDVSVDLADGFVDVSGFRAHPDGSGGDAIRFRVALGVESSRLTVVVSDVSAAGRPITGDVVDRWNARLADRIERAAVRHPNASLQEVVVGDDEVAFEWRIETAASR